MRPIAAPTSSMPPPMPPPHAAAAAAAAAARPPSDISRGRALAAHWTLPAAHGEAVALGDGSDSRSYGIVCITLAVSVSCDPCKY